MEGVESIMTFLRVIKWISFVVFILAIALTGVAHGFIFNEMGLFCKDQENKYMLAEVKDAIQAEDDIISSFFNKKEKTDDADKEADPVPMGTTGEATPIEAAAVAAPASEYNCEDVNEILVHVMKYGSYQIEMGWLNKLLKVESFKINLSILIGYIALFVAFVLHIITKRNKSVYGYILMIVGYILYAGLIAIGYYAGAYYISTFETTFVAEDIALFRVYTILAGFALATIVGVPYYRLGIRQITNKTLKKRIDNYKRKLQRRGA